MIVGQCVNGGASFAGCFKTDSSLYPQTVHLFREMSDIRLFYLYVYVSNIGHYFSLNKI